MGAVDLHILDHMVSPGSVLFGGVDLRTTPEQIAAKVGLPASAIRKRMEAWRRDGFLTGWNVLPHPQVLGMGHYVAHFQTGGPQDRRALLERLVDAPGVVAAMEHVGGVFGVGMYAKDQKAAVKHAQGLLQGDTKMFAPPGHVEIDPMERPLDADESALVAVMQAHPMASPAALAKETGVPERKIAKRLMGIQDARGIYTVPAIDFSRMNGALIRAIFDVDHDDPRPTYEALAKEYDISFYRRITNGKKVCGHAMVFLRSPVLQDELEERLMDLPGVTGVTFRVPRRFHPLGRWLEDASLLAD